VVIARTASIPRARCPSVATDSETAHSPRSCGGPISTDGWTSAGLNIVNKMRERLMASGTGKVKRSAGRPRVHKSETTVISFRVPKAEATQIAGLLSAIKLAERRVGEPDGNLLIEALKQRLRGLANHSPQIVQQTLRSLGES
jgi:hypothetical protein